MWQSSWHGLPEPHNRQGSHAAKNTQSANQGALHSSAICCFSDTVLPANVCMVLQAPERTHTNTQKRTAQTHHRTNSKHLHKMQAQRKGQDQSSSTLPKNSSTTCLPQPSQDSPSGHFADHLRSHKPSCATKVLASLPSAQQKRTTRHK